MAVGSMDYSYFHSAPLPYQYFDPQQTPAPIRDGDYRFEEYNSVAPNAEPYNPTFTQFQDTYGYDNTPVPPQRQSSTRPPSQSFVPPAGMSPGSTMYDAGYARTDPNDDLQRQRSSSEEKDSTTPQQNKRKAQNRAAQRAFRERKEKHLKDLEAKLADLQKQSMSLDSENEKLRKKMAELATENEILKATAGGQAPPGTDADDLFGPQVLNVSAYSLKLDKDDNSARPRFNPLQPMVVDEDSNEPLLSARHTWEYIQAHDLFRKGLVDVGDVCERLKKLARCHGQGPVFRESDIRKAIDESAVAGGRDELI